MKRAFIAFIALLVAAPLYAQNPNQAQLRLVVVDETGAGIPAATITVTPSTGAPINGVSDERGVATLPDMPPGAVKVHVEFPGFLATDQAVTLRRGANNQTITLKIEGFSENITVQDTTATDDRRGNSMSTTLEPEEIESLPDDPDAADTLTQLAGGAGAVFQVNGFRGGSLPLRDEIQQIRFRTNSFSADNHDAGRTQVEIITRPNVRAWTGNANLNYRSDSMNARNAFSTDKTPESNNQFNLGLRGPIVRNKTSLRINVDGRRDTQADTIVAVDEFGNRLGQAVSRPSDSTNVTIGVEHGLTSTHTLRFEFRNGVSSSENNGVGGFNLPSRATNRDGDNKQFRAQLQGVIGKTSLNELRFQYIDQQSNTTSLSDDRAIIVSDAFSSGGAGATNRTASKTYELADNFDFNVGRKQQMRVGFLLEGGQYNYFDESNFNGTFTFRNISDYVAGIPQNFRIRAGQVTSDFSTYQLGLYWQDDIKLSNKLSVSVGLRNELQSLLDDKTNLMPRFGFTANPFGPKTTFRGGYGIFYDWYDSSLYDQTLRQDGIKGAETLILNPGYPDPYSGTGAIPGNVQRGGRVQAAPGLKMPLTHQASIGVERQITQNFSAQLSYQMLRAVDQMRSINLNQPVYTVVGVDPDGNDLFDYVRPDLTVGNVTQFESTGRQHSDRLTLNMSYRLPQRGIFFNGNYTLASVKNDTDSATSLPADSLRPDLEWGPSRQDIRHRFQGLINLPIAYGVRTTFNINMQSAAPYTITLGTDPNKDGLSNERPDGVGRNSARGSATYVVNLRVAKQIAIGAPASVSPQRGPGGGGGGRGGGGGGFNAFTPGRYNVEFFVSANNLFNTVNYTSYSGNKSSTQFFLQPTAAQPARSVQVGASFRF